MGAESCQSFAPPVELRLFTAGESWERTTQPPVYELVYQPHEILDTFPLRHDRRPSFPHNRRRKFKPSRHGKHRR